MKSIFIGTLLFASLIFGVDRKLIISPQVLAEISQEYKTDTTVEKAYCLYGTQTVEQIVVNAMIVPDAQKQTANDVDFAEPCQPAFMSVVGAIEYLGVLHTHHGDAARKSTLSFEMTPPEYQGLSCSHYFILPSGERSNIPVTDYLAFELDSAATISVIYCGNKIVMIDRKNIDENRYVESTYNIIPSRVSGTD